MILIKVTNMASIVAITVSTNYHDILPIVYHYNRDFFKHWVFVTDKNDNETLKFLSDKPNVTILYWDFKNERRQFDKGGAIRNAQYYVYDKFPDEWYVLIDSDIVLPAKTQKFLIAEIPKINQAPGISEVAIFGAEKRLDFSRLSDLISENNYIVYDQKNYLCGYFQMYKEKYFYSPSRDASVCDIDFCGYFKKPFHMKDLICYHLGRNSAHWKGDRIFGSDFVIDVKLPK